MTRTAILFNSHILDTTVLSRLKKLRAEAPDGYAVYFFFDESKIDAKRAERLAGPATIEHGGEAWKRHKHPGHYFDQKIPGNGDAILLHAFHRLPRYEYYWHIEYDVAYSGHWGNFFDAFQENTADLLATSITRYEEIPEWPLWKTLQPPAGLELQKSSFLRSFNPIMRLSRRAFDTLSDEYKLGWTGHSECVLPTVLAKRGLAIEDIGGNGRFTPTNRINLHYRSSRINKSLSPGTFVFRPTMRMPGSEPNLLWHPVKNPAHKTWDDVLPPKNVLKRVLRSLFGRAR